MRDRSDDCIHSSSDSSWDQQNPRRAGAPSPPLGGEERVGEKEGGSGRSPVEPPNAFNPEILELFARREPAPAAPEGDNAGPWRVVKLHGDGPTRWGCFACGEQPPRLDLLEPDVAHLVAAGLSIAERPRRFRFQVDGPDGGRPTLHLLHDGHSLGTARRESEELPLHLTGLAYLRAQPLALAHLLMAVPDEVIDRTGVILARMLREAGQ